jgi:Tc toxin complex TcA C-terminal TcB-binding domain
MSHVMTRPTTAVGFHLVVTGPAAGSVVGRTATVAGRAFGFVPDVTVTEVRVSLAGGTEVTAPIDGLRRWSCEVTAPRSLPGGTAMTAVAQAYGTTDGDPALMQIGSPAKRNVILDGTVPDLLTIDNFATPVVTQPGRPHVLDLTGTAGDANSGIRSVEVKVDDGTFVPVDELVEGGPRAGTHVWTWRKRALQVFADIRAHHRFTVRATDGTGNIVESTKEIEVRLPAEAGPADQAFGPTRYLAALSTFVHRYVRIDGTTDPVTPQMLAERLHQPFDRLTEPALFEQVTAPILQARIAVEVLRRHLSAPSPGRRFRSLAYLTFLRGLGTSYDELRLARTDEARATLADRLGIGPAAAGPARIGLLTVAPDSVNDSQLESLFGYRSPAAIDPLRPVAEAAQVLLWKRDALHTRWRDEDAARRDTPGDPTPLIDPDIVPESGIRTRTPDDAAYALWSARRAWIGETLAQISATQPDATEPVRFDALVATFVGALDPPLTVLAEQDADGADIRPDLPRGLDLDAFRFLARSRALLADGTPLATGWDDVTAILLQVQKARRYQPWRTEENRASLVLEPATFTLDTGPSAGSAGVSRWRFSRSEHLAWRRTLAARGVAADALEAGHRRILDATEATVLPQQRDAIIARLAAEAEPPAVVAERLGRELLIDLQADGDQLTTRVDQALETVRGLLLAVRAGLLADGSPGTRWVIDVQPEFWPIVPGGEPRLKREFDRELAWMGSFGGWLSVVRIFAYPENQLLPALYVARRDQAARTHAFDALIEAVRTGTRLTPADARDVARDYITQLHDSGALKRELTIVLTDELTDAELVLRQGVSKDPAWFSPDVPHREIFWLVPMAIAGALRAAGQLQAALDWYRTVFAHHLPPEHRRIYHGLTVERGIETTPDTYSPVPEWLLGEVNPHEFATNRPDCYTRATIAAIAGCLSAFADDEFGRGTRDGNARARALYGRAIDLLGSVEFEPHPHDPFPPNPVRESMLAHARSGLAKIHRGLNIAGTAGPTTAESTLPSQYRYSTLVERAKGLMSIAQQVEASYLSVLEQRDAKAYDELRARNDLEVAGATVTLHTTKLAVAVTSVRLADLQRQRARLQEDHFTQLIDDGYTGWETAAQAALGAAAELQIASGVLLAADSAVETLKAAISFGFLGHPGESAAQSLAAFASAAGTGAQIAQVRASHERQVQEWELQRDLAAHDGEIADKQVQAAEFGLQLAGQERQLAVLQQDHAAAVATFLATRFTNAELFEWMSGVLGRVYAFVLQQATALARLAEAQLAFERQELPAGFVGADYWRDATAGAPDRRGLTGSARLLEDVTRLDQYAFDTDRRKLHLTQTFPLSQLAAFELQLFRETGVLTFATPEVLFDREFPGHYLRLVKRVRVSLVALLPPVRGVRATLAASGVSRTVVARGPFETVALRRDPESIAFTSPVNATGLFDLEPESGLLLPFEGMGVDTVWRLELPKAANPFDFRSIADVLLTVEYTALESAEYRERVVRELNRRFSGDRTFSVRNDFPDAWFDLHNPDTVDPDRRMRVDLPITADDLPPHILDLHVEQISLFAVRADTLTDELTVASLRHGQTASTGPVTTIGGIISTRRPAGEPWNVHLRADPTGIWEIQLPDDEVVRSWFHDELVDDIVLVLTVGGTTPEWP